MEWISLKDKHRLPEDRQQVLIYTNVNQVWIAYYSKTPICGQFCFDVDDDRYIYDFEKITTHWMPLPNPPKEN